MDKEEARQQIIKLLNETQELIPDKLVPNLDPLEGFPEAPDWHQFEHDIWNNGETIRQLLKTNKYLLSDKMILERIVSICLNRNAKRGRQSFIMLLWNKHGRQFSNKLVEHLDDKCVDGHIIEGLNKMKIDGYVSLVQPFCNDKVNWIRKQAIKYVETFKK